jgi:hypothetical protein
MEVLKGKQCFSKDMQRLLLRHQQGAISRRCLQKRLHTETRGIDPRIQVYKASAIEKILKKRERELNWPHLMMYRIDAR